MGRNRRCYRPGTPHALDSRTMVLPFFVGLAILGAWAPGEAPPALMPVPASVTWLTGRLRLDSTFSVRVAGTRPDARLTRAIDRYATVIRP